TGSEPSPAPVASSVVLTGMLATAQCQKPLAVGASGSKQVTTKLWVSSGNPLQDSCGEMSSPPAPMIPLTCALGRVWPSATSVLVTVNDGTSGRKSYGEGGVATGWASFARFGCAFGYEHTLQQPLFHIWPNARETCLGVIGGVG